MIRLYQGSGSGEIELLDQRFASEDWERLKAVAVRLLEHQGQMKAAELLRVNAFDLFNGTNGFGDEFLVLYMKAPFSAYVELAEQAADPSFKFHFSRIASAVGEVGHYVRFIAVELDGSLGPEPVESPTLTITSDVVERALRDAQRLIATEGATSGVDRVHTAFHGYLRAIASKALLQFSDNAEITELFRVIREQHPVFRPSSARPAEIDRLLRQMANIIDTLNPVRNHASVAHPNEQLLETPEAMLVINSVRSLLHYINAKLG